MLLYVESIFKSLAVYLCITLCDGQPVEYSVNNVSGCGFLVFSAQVKVFVTGLFSLNQDIPAFKEHLRDFLVQIKVSVQRKRQLDKSVSRAQFSRLVVFFSQVKSEVGCCLI